MASRDTSSPLNYWLPVLVGVALFAPIVISTVAHAELFLGILLVGLSSSATILLFRGQDIAFPRTIALVCLAFLGVLAARSFAATEPMSALYGAYGADGSLLAYAAIFAGLIVPAAWGRSAGQDSEGPFQSLLVVVAAYACASAIAAWMWGSTDGVGGPASGFTSNSQYQLQLLIIGLAAVAGLITRVRRTALNLGLAAVAATVLVVNIVNLRSSAVPLAIGVAAVYAYTSVPLVRRLGARAVAASWSALMALATAAFAFLLLSDGVAGWTERLDTLGNARGTLWTSAYRVIAANPWIGRGPTLATPVTRWSLSSSGLDLTTTTDPHNVLLSVGIGGGIVVLALAIVLFYNVQVSIFETLLAADDRHRRSLLALLTGAAAVVVLSLFAFMYPVAWALAAILIGCNLTQDSKVTRLTDDLKGRITAVAATALAVGLAAFAVVPVSARSESLMLTAGQGWSTPIELLQRQLALADDSWDLMPAKQGLAVYVDGMGANAELVDPLRPEVDRVRTVVGRNLVWDARLSSQEVLLWMADKDAGRADIETLRTAIDAGIVADPASGMWAAVGCAKMAEAGETELATEYARMVLADPVWLAQARSSADASTVALIEDLGK